MSCAGLRFYFLVALFVSNPCALLSAEEPWRDHTVFGINKLEPHASLFPYLDKATALADKRQASLNYMLLICLH